MPFDNYNGPTNEVTLRRYVQILGKLAPVVALAGYAAVIIIMRASGASVIGMEGLKSFPWLFHLGAGTVVLTALVGSVVRRMLVAKAVNALVEPGGSSRCFSLLQGALLVELFAVDFCGIIGLLLFFLAGLVKEPLYLMAGAGGLWVYFIMQHPEYEVIAKQAQQMADLEASNRNDK